LLVVRENCVWLPESPLLQGTYRLLQNVFKELDIPSNVQRLKLMDLTAAAECFLLNDYWEIQPVSAIGESKIGKGEVGPITQTLSSGLAERLRLDSKPIF
jgi:branched-subunit amino acid aminotransferase/4-amino-4-deoxychorismate lyase